MARREKQMVAVAKTDEIPASGCKLVTVKGRSIGIFCVKGDFVAVLNVCPHELGPVCKGRVTGTTLPSKPGEPFVWAREGEILACPWHGWEFELATGKALADKRRLRLYPVQVEDGTVYVEI